MNPTWMLKALSRRVLWLTRVCQVIWCFGRAPKDWLTGLVIPVSKKADRMECNNRGISLLSLPGKVYAKWLEKRRCRELSLSRNPNQSSSARWKQTTGTAIQPPPWGGIHEWRVCVSFIALWWQNGSFQTPQSCQFFICSDPHLWSWSLGNDWKFVIKIQAVEMGACEEFTGWDCATKSVAVKSWMSNHFSKLDLSEDGSAAWPECPRKDRQGKFRCLH